MATNVVEINTDVKCSRCGKGGAIKDQRDGLCMECIGKRMKAELKKDRITAEMLQEIAWTIESILIEDRENIEWAFQHVPDGFKISITMNIEHTVPPTVKYNVSFALEPAREPVQKHKVTLKKVIGQGEMDL